MPKSSRAHYFNTDVLAATDRLQHPRGGGKCATLAGCSHHVAPSIGTNSTVLAPRANPWRAASARDVYKLALSRTRGGESTFIDQEQPKTAHDPGTPKRGPQAGSNPFSCHQFTVQSRGSVQFPMSSQ
jgi:hypothetical protein